MKQEDLDRAMDEFFALRDAQERAQLERELGHPPTDEEWVGFQIKKIRELLGSDHAFEKFVDDHGYWPQIWPTLPDEIKLYWGRIHFENRQTRG